MFLVGGSVSSLGSICGSAWGFHSGLPFGGSMSIWGFYLGFLVGVSSWGSIWCFYLGFLVGVSSWGSIWGSIWGSTWGFYLGSGFGVSTLVLHLGFH